MTKFNEIPTVDFPLSYTTYCRLRDEIEAISARFSDLGTSEGVTVAKQMERVYAALGDAWELIRAIEHHEKRP